MTTQNNNAGFWLRFVAVFIDGIVLSIVNLILVTPIIGLLGLTAASGDYSAFSTDGGMAALIGGIIVTYLAIFIAGWLYYAIMESSNKQGTLGKMLIGLKVTDLEGNRISFGKATGRYFGKIVSAIILYIGFMMAGFTEKKQGLHDIMAGSLVVKK
jgi:uncharacterized RDD family membrane protein YckC